MADKYIYNNAGTLTEKEAKTTSAGAGDAGKVVALDAAGKLDTSFMPTGIAADTASITASEALSAGDYVNIWNSTGAKARKADATTAGKEAHGFVLAAVSNGASATVYFEGTNSSVTGQTPGVVFLSTTPGAGTTTAPSASGNVVQRIGFASSATAVNFQSQEPIVLA
ncbi:MAG TPA: hypothetical protein VGD05_07605 [Pyrinomonadaceae bacterium]|jgi:hypothetical protein